MLKRMKYFLKTFFFFHVFFSFHYYDFVVDFFLLSLLLLTITASLPYINCGGSTAVQIPRRRGVEFAGH